MVLKVLGCFGSGSRVLGSLGFLGRSRVHWFGMPGASTRLNMAGARAYTELDAWKLANQLKLGVYALIRAGEVQRDFEFRDQIEKRCCVRAPKHCGRLRALRAA